MADEHDDDFYEEDEPIEKVLAAFERGEKMLSAPPGTVAIGAPNWSSRENRLGRRAG